MYTCAHTTRIHNVLHLAFLHLKYLEKYSLLLSKEPSHFFFMASPKSLFLMYNNLTSALLDGYLGFPNLLLLQSMLQCITLNTCHAAFVKVDL